MGNHVNYSTFTVTKSLKIGDFTVYAQVINCMHARSAGPVADQLADYPT